MIDNAADEGVRMRATTRRLTIAGLVALLTGVVPFSSAGAEAPGSVDDAASLAATSDPVGIEVLSNRADLVSGGQALVEITTPEGINPKSVRVQLNGRMISRAFAPRADGRLVGLVEDLRPGDNQLTAAVRRQRAELTVTNHSRSGPIFSGPQRQPWLCTTELNGLGEPTDEQCNAPTRTTWRCCSTPPSPGSRGPRRPAGTGRTCGPSAPRAGPPT